jgi:2-dehydro-3-deoxygalactonokinase
MNDGTIGIGCDWGTTNLRLYRLGNDGLILEKRDLSAGIMTIKNAEFESAFYTAMGDWLSNYPNAHIILSGMIGSRQGWKETPYLSCPTNVEKISQGLVPLKLGNGRRIWLTPGLSYINKQGSPDVMRGEEVQILGALTALGSHKMLVCLPGSHSKWAKIIAGEVLEFNTYITGELFEAIKSNTIIGKMIDPGSWDDNAFLEGVDHANSSNNLLNQLFNVRAKGLFNQLTPFTAGAFLSGLLIGHELKEALIDGKLHKICLIGQGRLVTLYEKALVHGGVKSQTLSSDIIATGHMKLMKTIKRII